MRRGYYGIDPTPFEEAGRRREEHRADVRREFGFSASDPVFICVARFAPQKALVEVCAQITGNPHGRIWVRGHTDNDPVKRPATLEMFPHGNLQLSAARAVEVAMVMISDGKVGADDISVMGFGEHMPLKENNSADNKRFNRRVEIYVSSGE